MQLITITSEAYQQLIEKIDALHEEKSSKSDDYPLREIWLDIQETSQLLKVSKRTLQNYRDRNILPFSKTGGKIYFKASDIQKLLEDNYKPSLNNRKDVKT